MHTRTYENYIEFLHFAQQHEKDAKNIKFYDGRLYSFNTSSVRCKFLCNTSAITPNNFVKYLGFNNYNAFTRKCFSHIKEFAPTSDEALKWYSGYFGGLIGINKNIINDYVGDGEINTFYDYDINKAYLHALTNWLPTKYVKSMTYLEYLSINEIDRASYCFFFEIRWTEHKGRFLKVLGNIKSSMNSFDFINSKQFSHMIVSDLRFELIKKIYFFDFKVVKIHMFEKRRFRFFRNILDAYCEHKEEFGEEFKRNALRLYGTFGQIYKKIPTKFHFEKSGLLHVVYDIIVNEKASPQVAMYVADMVATKLFDIISKNMDCVISWNTDGLTSTKPLNLQIGTSPGKWKTNKIVGTPFLFDDCSTRAFYKDVERNKIFGGDTITEKNGKFEFWEEFKYTNLYTGYKSKKVKRIIEPTIKFDNVKTLRSIVRLEQIKELRKEYVQF